MSAVISWTLVCTVGSVPRPPADTDTCRKSDPLVGSIFCIQVAFRVLEARHGHPKSQKAFTKTRSAFLRSLEGLLRFRRLHPASPGLRKHPGHDQKVLPLSSWRSGETLLHGFRTHTKSNLQVLLLQINTANCITKHRKKIFERL